MIAVILLWQPWQSNNHPFQNWVSSLQVVKKKTTKIFTIIRNIGTLLFNDSSNLPVYYILYLFVQHPSSPCLVTDSSCLVMAVTWNPE